MHIVIQIILAYFLAGSLSILSLFITALLMRKGKVEGDPKTALFLMLILPFWPIYAWSVLRTSIFEIGQCAHCGHMVRGKEAIKHHIYVCPKNPVVAELNAARKVCQWVDQEISADCGAVTDWSEAGKLMIEWLKAKA
jgi:hypothetical protein